MTGASDNTVGVPTELTEDFQPLKRIDVNHAFRRYVGKIPENVAAVPSMMSVAEKRLLFGLAEKYYSGEGLIVDAGIFLGASTRCFGEGLKRNANLRRALALRKKPIVSFEKGDINPGMPIFFKRNRIEFDAPVGDSFIALTKQNIDPISKFVDLRIGDIMEDDDPIELPIEICFLDILKLPHISLRCFERFYPLFIPGRSIVLQQDYFYEKLPYIKTHQEFLDAHFDFIGEVGSTAIFRCSSAVPLEKLAALGDLDQEQQLRLAGRALQRSHDPWRRLLMALSRLRLVGKLLGKKEAARQLEMVKAEYPDQIEGSQPRRIVEAMTEIEEFCYGKPDAASSAAMSTSQSA